VGSVYSFGISNFDGNGSVLTANDSANGNWTYHYDNLNRLQWAKLNGQEFDYYPEKAGQARYFRILLGRIARSAIVLDVPGF
jgi:hypothetical protein